jgi:hypothetical protein
MLLGASNYKRIFFMNTTDQKESEIQMQKFLGELRNGELK